ETLVVGLDGSLRGELDEAWREWDRLRPGRKELPPFETFSAVRRHLAESRIKAALDLVEGFEGAGQPLGGFSAHREPVLRIGGRPGWGGITGDTSPPKRQELVEAFQLGQLKGLALTISAGGVGLTLTRASVALFIDLDWGPENNRQAEDRFCR